MNTPLSHRIRLNGVEALRGVAALLVVAVHARTIVAIHGAPPFGDFWVFGRAGVDFFFVLSGFIIAFVHARDLGMPGTLGTFWAKRRLRIYPAYWVASAGFLALLLVSPTQERAERDLAHVACSFLLCPEQADPILGVGWSLRHELLFYALFSTALISRRLGGAVLTTWGAGIAWNAAVHAATGTPWFNGVLDVIVFRGANMQFFFGLGVAYLVHTSRVWRPGLVATLGGAGFLATGMFESYGVPIMHEWPLRTLAYAINSAAILYGLAILDGTRRLRVPGVAVLLGGASYSIYLVHVPVLLVLEYAARPALAHVASELAFAALVTCATGAGIAFSLAVEQPLGRVSRAWHRRTTGRPRRFLGTHVSN